MFYDVTCPKVRERACWDSPDGTLQLWRGQGCLRHRPRSTPLGCNPPSLLGTKGGSLPQESVYSVGRGLINVNRHWHGVIRVHGPVSIGNWVYSADDFEGADEPWA